MKIEKSTKHMRIPIEETIIRYTEKEVQDLIKKRCREQRL